MRGKTIRKNQIGFVSITVTVIISILLTLVITSFALVVRREQRLSLDRQLSAQAFYAAEAGIADVKSLLNKKNPDGSPIINQDNDYVDCDAFKNAASSISGYSNRVGNAEYTCALVRFSSKNIQNDNVSPADGPQLYPLNSDSPISSINFGWETPNVRQFADGGLITGDRNGLPQGVNQSLPTGMVRLTIIPGFKNPDGTDAVRSRNDLVSGSQTLFLYPNVSPTPGNVTQVDYTPGLSGSNQGLFVRGNCHVDNKATTSTYCNVRINFTNPTQQLRQYYVYFSSYYQPISTNIRINNGNDNINNSQAIIDVTGKSADVLRRLQARVPVAEAAELNRGANSRIPDTALEATQGICKRLEIGLTTFRDLCGPNPTQQFPLTSPVPSNSVGGP